MIVFPDAYNVTLRGSAWAALIVLSYVLSVVVLVRALKKDRADWKIFTLCGLVAIFPIIVFVAGLVLFLP